jgi:hypothetical protein
MVLNDLNKNDNDYPENVYVTECAGYSFRHLSCSGSSGQIGVGPSINIGTKSYLGELLHLKFENVRAVIENYDRIADVLDSLARQANPLHIRSKLKESNFSATEEFLFFQKKTAGDQDPIFNLLEVTRNAESAKTLPWECDSCCKK